MLPDANQSLNLYWQEVERLPQLSDEDAQALVEWIGMAQTGQASAQLGTTVRNALVEGSLHLVPPIALRYAASRQVEVLDLIQEGNLGLLEALESGADIEQTWSAYATGIIRHVIAHALVDNSLTIRVPYMSLRKAKLQGQAEELYEMQPDSLDAPLPKCDGLCLADLIEAPASGGESASAAQHRRQRVEQLLAALPDQERLALQLRFGLAEDDQREHSYAEIAHKLDIQVSAAYGLIARAIEMLQGLRETPAQREERQAEVRNAQLRARLEAAGLRVTVQQHKARERQARLDDAYRQLCQQQGNITAEALAELAHVSKSVAVAYLQQAQPDGEARQLGMTRKTWLRLVRAYHQLQEQRANISTQVLSTVAGVTWRAAERFLTAQQQQKELAVV